MEDDKLLQRFPSPDGKRWFELRRQSDGMFYFQEFSESPGRRSGLRRRILHLAGLSIRPLHERQSSRR